MGLEIILSMEASLAMLEAILEMGNLVGLIVGRNMWSNGGIGCGITETFTGYGALGVRICLSLVELELGIHLPLLLDKQLAAFLVTTVGAMDVELQRVVMVSWTWLYKAKQWI